MITLEMRLSTSLDYNFENCIYVELDKHITHEEIINVVKNLKMNKAHGIDNLINEYFMASIDILVEHISTILMLFWTQDSFQIIGLNESLYLFSRKMMLMM